MTSHFKLYGIFLLIIFCHLLYAQKPYQPNAAEIYEKIEELSVLGTALYVAAHPDDENQRLISYLSNHKGFETTYLSLTRGDGGQNLIGTEIQEELGVIRTQELLGARSIDGGQQRFSRAIDFGYSKHPDETFAIWDKEAVLGDLVYAIRDLKPDFIITRFDHRTPGKTHGHHTGSAILAQEAFTLASDPQAYKEQLKRVDPWQSSAIFMNTSWWFYGSREKFAEADKTNLYSVDVGIYYPAKGKSNTEISQEARTMHKCQGFGATGYRGVTEEWLEYIQGPLVPKKEDVFGGVNTSWTRVKGGGMFEARLDRIKSHYSLKNPGASVKALAALYEDIGALSNNFWKSRKQEKIKEIIRDCLGLYIEVSADVPSGIHGDSVTLNLEAINRSSQNCLLTKIDYLDRNADIQVSLSDNEIYKQTFATVLNSSLPISSPFWLEKKGTMGLYDIDDVGLRTQPSKENLLCEVFLDVEGIDISYQSHVVYKWNDPVDGESYKPFVITNPVSISMNDEAYLFKTDETKSITVSVQAWSSDIIGEVKLELPEGWISEPQSVQVELNQYLEDRDVIFKISHTASAINGKLRPYIKTKDGEVYDKQIKLIEYDHIPTQIIHKEASSKLIYLDIKTSGHKLGYVMGAGDDVPRALNIMGYDVDLIDVSSLQPSSLQKYDAVLVGIRAFNVLDELRYKNKELFDYAYGGGTVIVQYNTNHRLKTDKIAPYPIKLSRERVTDETADISFLAPDHKVLNEPNKITAYDFENWVQERGLYFPNKWDEKYTPIIACNDAGETSKEGSLLVAKHGEGYYIYTGLSFFRELPASVTGAYRLLANLIAIGEENE